MAWKKSPPELIAAFEKAKPPDPTVTSRPMFGYPALFLKGNMFAGTYQDKIVVRFGEDRTIAGAKAAKPFEPMPGAR
jgi:TfoX/Sxy family transcriptional regulator of competence genes